MKKSLKFCKSKTGFTLVELVIVIAIVIILSVISVPIYRGYVDKSKMAEGYALLGAILSAQKAYYSEYGNFLKSGNATAGMNGFTVYEPILGVDARGSKYFTFFRPGTEANSQGKDFFSAFVKKPKELCENGYTRLGLNYYIVSGATFSESNG